MDTQINPLHIFKRESKKGFFQILIVNRLYDEGNCCSIYISFFSTTNVHSLRDEGDVNN